MEYTKTNWQTGDVITDEKLNKLEEALRKATPMTVDFTISEVGGIFAVSTQAVFADVKAAVTEGRTVRARVSLGEGQPAMYFPLTIASPGGNPNTLIFLGTADLSGSDEAPKPQLLSLAFDYTGQCSVSFTDLCVAEGTDEQEEENT